MTRRRGCKSKWAQIAVGRKLVNAMARKAVKGEQRVRQ
jgi:hypothetical protein